MKLVGWLVAIGVVVAGMMMAFVEWVAVHPRAPSSPGTATTAPLAQKPPGAAPPPRPGGLAPSAAADRSRTAPLEAAESAAGPGSKDGGDSATPYGDALSRAAALERSARVLYTRVVRGEIESSRLTEARADLERARVILARLPHADPGVRAARAKLNTLLHDVLKALPF
jgi:hypothetical protein